MTSDLKNSFNYPFITFDNVTLRVRDRRILCATDWVVAEGENWAVIGPNGSGKSTLMRAIAGETPVVGGAIRRHHPLALPERIGYVSFETHRNLIAREQAADDARFFSGDIERYLTAGTVVDGGKIANGRKRTPAVGDLFTALGVRHLLKRPVRFLSTGEIRRILIARAVLRSRGLLLLDEPFEGLDREGRVSLAATIRRLLASGLRVMLATHRVGSLLPAFSHVIALKDGRVYRSGPREAVLARDVMERIYEVDRAAARPGPLVPGRAPLLKGNETPVVIEMKKTSVRYGDLTVFENLNWIVRKGENWSITGPNGSGKTTLLQLVIGDHPQAYANEIYLFGRRRGSGESVWDIKRRMGVVSSEFQINYRKPIKAIDVVLSGFFDSIGLYRRVDRQQTAAAEAWIERLNLGHLAQKRFDLLSFGERRMILTARAVVKSPEVLVLDEPCQGLDPANRKRILGLIDAIGRQTHTQILYVSHHPEEMPGCITSHLRLPVRQ